jgi:hypothetical protein
MLPSLGYMCELGVVLECSGTLLNFPSSSTFRLHFLHNLPPFQPTFTRRTSGHCLGTFIAVNVALSSPLLIQNRSRKPGGDETTPKT